MAGLLEQLLHVDRTAFLFINSHSGSVWDSIFGIGTHLGDGLVLTLLVLAGLRLFDRNRFPKNFILIGLAMLLASGVEQSVKHLVERERPAADQVFKAGDEPLSMDVFSPGLTVRTYAIDGKPFGIDNARLKILGSVLRKNSFPSGHSSASFAAATGLIYIFRRKRKWLLLLPAGFVGVSRIACGVHFPLDVLAGAVIGSVVSVGFLRVFEIFHGLGSAPDSIARKRRSGPPKIMMVVGEASADVYGSRILDELKRQAPGLEAAGVGGDLLRKSGLRAVAGAHELSIVGFTAVLTSLAAIVRIYRACVRMLREESPDALVCIDLPDFNLMLATQARRRSIPVLYFISPQFWAWRQGRVRKIADRLSRMVVAFGFEAPFYEKAGVPVSFHGHPILETLARRFETKDEAKKHFGLDPAKKTLVLAPGSRGNEFKYVMPDLFAAGAKIIAEFPDWQIAVPVAPRAKTEEMRKAAERAGIAPVFTHGDNFDLFACADFGLVCSGTATLEAALAGLPMLIVYRGQWLNYFLAKRLVKIKHIGLPNIILGDSEPAFPELIQAEAEAAPLAEKAISTLRDGHECAKLRTACARVRESLQSGETSRLVAREILSLAGKP